MTNDEKQGNHREIKPKARQHFDLAERTAVFGEEVVRFVKKIPPSAITRPLITQVVRSGTSIGANYCEANDAESKADFRHKIGLCRKESAETKYWLRIIVAAVPELRDQSAILWTEAHSLNRTFGKIRRSSEGR